MDADGEPTWPDYFEYLDVDDTGTTPQRNTRARASRPTSTFWSDEPYVISSDSSSDSDFVITGSRSNISSRCTTRSENAPQHSSQASSNAQSSGPYPWNECSSRNRRSASPRRQPANPSPNVPRRVESLEGNEGLERDKTWGGGRKMMPESHNNFLKTDCYGVTGLQDALEVIITPLLQKLYVEIYAMRLHTQWSWGKDDSGCAKISEKLPAGASPSAGGYSGLT